MLTNGVAEVLVIDIGDPESLAWRLIFTSKVS